MKLFLCFFLFNLSAHARWTGQGEVALELRQFSNDNLRTTEDRGIAVFSRLESRYERRRKKFVFRGFARVDQHDTQRDFLSLEDSYFSYKVGRSQNLEFLAGYKLFNWTATEAFHPADVINSRNFDSNIESFEKKGELTLSAKQTIAEATVSVFLFPRYESPEFPGAKSRLGFGITLEEPKWVEGNGLFSEDHYGLQGGLRLTQTIGDLDYSLHFMRHLDRDNPLIEVNILNGTFTPIFFPVDQVGGTATYVFESLIFKIEAAYRNFKEEMTILTARGPRRPQDHGRVAMGLEYTLTLPSGHDLNAFIEGQGIFGLTQEKRAEQDIFQRDLFLGVRYALNDSMGTEVFFSFITDIERANESLYNLNITRRISDNWKYKTGFRVVRAPLKSSFATGLETLHKDDNVFFNLTRYF